MGGDLKMMKTINLRKALTHLITSLFTALAFFLISNNFKAIFINFQKPIFSLSFNVLFIVWAILIFILGIASYLVKESEFIKKQLALKLYCLTLFLNLIWAIVFFYFQINILSIVIILLLWTVAIITTILFYFADKTAGKIIALYLLWLSYATYINMGIVVLN